MKMTLTIPVPGDKPMVLQAEGSPDEVAQFLRMWLSFQQTTDD